MVRAGPGVREAAPELAGGPGLTSLVTPVSWSACRRSGPICAPADPFVVVAAGRAPFRTADLLKLADEVARLRSGADDVQKILP